MRRFKRWVVGYFGMELIDLIWPDIVKQVEDAYNKGYVMGSMEAFRAFTAKMVRETESIPYVEDIEVGGTD